MTLYIILLMLCSLLEEVVDFDPMTAPAPVISEETTVKIEDIIKQRIIDQVSHVVLISFYH